MDIQARIENGQSSVVANTRCQSPNSSIEQNRYMGVQIHVGRDTPGPERNAIHHVPKKDKKRYRHLMNKGATKYPLTPRLRDLLAERSGSPILLSSSNDGAPILALCPTRDWKREKGGWESRESRNERKEGREWRGRTRTLRGETKLKSVGCGETKKRCIIRKVQQDTVYPHLGPIDPPDQH